MPAPGDAQPINQPDHQSTIPSTAATTSASVTTGDVDDFGLADRHVVPRVYEEEVAEDDEAEAEGTPDRPQQEQDAEVSNISSKTNKISDDDSKANGDHTSSNTIEPTAASGDAVNTVFEPPAQSQQIISNAIATGSSPPDPARGTSVSEWSHQLLAPKVEQQQPEEVEEDAWQEMPAYATHTMYDDWGKVIAREEAELYEEDPNLGGAGKGYTKVQIDEDAKSATSMDDDTAYLFKQGGRTTTLDEEDEEGRDMLSQMQTTKELLTEGQRIAYVGIVRLCTMEMIKAVDDLEHTKNTKKHIDLVIESLKMWSQKMMVRLYGHMDVNSSEQVMIEQLAEHGVQSGDLTPALMQNARVKNPVSEQQASKKPSKEDMTSSVSSLPQASGSGQPSRSETPADLYDAEEEALPAYSKDPSSQGDQTVKSPSELAGQKNIDIDLRWTVLCDLFLVLVADSIYDSRSRTLLERVGGALSIDWLEICRFEKRVTDALEMQQEAEKENWNEQDHMIERKKSSRNRKLMYMGLATVGGGLVIGLSAGLLAPVIGAGLAAGFTTIGVAGTGSFFGGVGAAALITSTGVITGGTVGVRATNRRMGAIKTFEYRPLYNNKRVNLIVTVAGWMTGKVDDVRLPFSTIDPIMGDMYSVLWEPEMLQSMGQTINILATEALTQGLQQLLASTILTALMGAIQLPLILTKLSYLVDNPWNVSMSRADAAGLILADSLIDKNLGSRPITLVAFSIGSRVIFSCLKELAKRGALDIVQNVYMFGSPVVVSKDDWIRARTVVSGRFVNGYATNDWILGYLFRATAGGIMRVAGLAATKIPGIEDINVTELVKGHMAYRAAMPRLMQEVGWSVESLEFSEIEDPDPDNHDARQRELMDEIENARKNLEKKPSKKGLRGLFLSKSKKRAEKKAWETYEGPSKTAPEGSQANGTEGEEDSDVMFDVDAIRAEAAALAVHGLEVKELKSTLPPMQLNVHTPPLSARTSTSGSRSPYSGTLRHATSFAGDIPHRPRSAARSVSSGDDRGLASPDEGPVSMTFEDENKPSWSAKQSPIYQSRSPSSGRPRLSSSNTMPYQSSSSAAGYNAWANEEEFGHEETEMTFE